MELDEKLNRESCERNAVVVDDAKKTVGRGVILFVVNQKLNGVSDHFRGHFEALYLLVLADSDKQFCEAGFVDLGVKPDHYLEKVGKGGLVGLHVFQKHEDVVVDGLADQLLPLSLGNLHKQGLVQFIGFLVYEIFTFLCGVVLLLLTLDLHLLFLLSTSS